VVGKYDGMENPRAAGIFMWYDVKAQFSWLYDALVYFFMNRHPTIAYFIFVFFLSVFCLPNFASASNAIMWNDTGISRVGMWTAGDLDDFSGYGQIFSTTFISASGATGNKPAQADFAIYAQGSNCNVNLAVALTQFGASAAGSGQGGMEWREVSYEVLTGLTTTPYHYLFDFNASHSFEAGKQYRLALYQDDSATCTARVVTGDSPAGASGTGFNYFAPPPPNNNCQNNGYCTMSGGLSYVKPDNRLYPVTTIYDPLEGQTWAVDALNRPYRFRATTDVSAADYPDEVFYFQFQISRDGSTDYQTPDLPLIAHTLDHEGNYARVWSSTYIFEGGHQYAIRARSKTSTAPDFGTWSEWVNFISTGEITSYGSAIDAFKHRSTEYPTVCGLSTGEDWSFDDGFISGIGQFFLSFGRAMKAGIWDLVMFGCNTDLYSPVMDIALQKTPTKQLIFITGATISALENTEATGDLVMAAPYPFDEGQITIFSARNTYDFWGGDAGWGRYARPTIAVLSIMSVLFYFAWRARLLFKG
jgi:hypothetical protein